MSRTWTRTNNILGEVRTAVLADMYEWLFHALKSICPHMQRMSHLQRLPNAYEGLFKTLLPSHTRLTRMKRTGVPWLLSNGFNVMIPTTGAGTALKSRDPDHHLSSCVFAYFPYHS